MFAPKLTVGITCQKEGPLLAQAIESVCLQTFTDFECIVLNDGCVDEETTRICRAIMDPRFIVIFRSTVGGPSIARNEAINRSNAEIYVPLDGDDILPPGALCAIYEAFHENPSAGFVYGNMRVRGDWNYDFVPQAYQRCSILGGMPFGGMSPFLKKTWFKVGGFDPALSIGRQDWEFWISVFHHGISGAYINEYIYEYRSRTGTVSRRCEAHYGWIVEYIYKKHQSFIDSCFFGCKLLRTGYERAAKASYVANERKNALKWAIKAISKGSFGMSMIRIVIFSLIGSEARTSVRNALGKIFSK